MTRGSDGDALLLASFVNVHPQKEAHNDSVSWVQTSSRSRSTDVPFALRDSSDARSRGTKKLRDRLKGAPRAEPDATSTTELGDWFATALFWRPQVALLVNQKTFIPVLVELAPAATLLDRVPETIETVLRHHGLDQEFVSAERGAMSEVRLAPTNDRRVVGVMNELTFQAEIRRQEGMDNLVELSLDLARAILGPLHNRGGSPTGDGPGQAVAVPAEGAGFVDPPCLRFGDRQPGLRPARVDRSLPLDRGRFPAGRIAAFAFEERLGQHLAERFDLGGALGEHLEQLVGDTIDLGLALDDRSPGHAVAVRQLGSQHRLVEPAGRTRSGSPADAGTTSRRSSTTRTRTKAAASFSIHPTADRLEVLCSDERCASLSGCRSIWTAARAA